MCSVTGKLLCGDQNKSVTYNCSGGTGTGGPPRHF